MTSNRIEYIDLARAVAVISVIAYHFLQIDEIWGLSTFINTYFLSVFFVISGLLLHLQTDMKWICRKIKRLLLPLVSFSAIYIPILLLCSDSPANTILHHIFWSDAKGGYWFVYTLLASLLLIWIVFYFKERFSLPNWCYWIILSLPWFIACGMSIILPQDIVYLLSISSFRRYYLFILLGMWLQQEQAQQLIHKTSIYVLGSLCYLLLTTLSICKFQHVDSGLSFAIWGITNIFGCLFILETSRRICQLYKIHSITKWLSQDSLGIYLGQFIIRRISSNAFMALSISPYISFIPYTLFLMITSLALTRILRKNTITTKLFLGL